MIAAMVVSAVFFLCVLGVAWPLGKYVYRVMECGEDSTSVWERLFLSTERKVFKRVESVYFQKMTWKEYFIAFLSFHTIGIVWLFLLLRFQGVFSCIDDSAKNMSAFTAFNTAISFATNTDWQAYIPERDMSWIVATFGLGTQQFFSGAAGICLLCCLARAFVSRESTFVGNFWKDLVRSSVCVLLPLSLVFGPLLVATGVPQSCQGHVSTCSLENRERKQDLVLGCTASFVAVKQLGTNGGGLYDANGAHPFENPTPLSNIIQILAMLLLPIALCRTFGEIVRFKNQARLLICVMGSLCVVACFFALLAEGGNIPYLGETNLFQSSGNMEGKECRFGPFWSILWSVATTATSTGSVNSSLSSYLPLGAGVPLALMQLGEVAFGGVGTGVTGAIVYLLIAVFAAGLMVGRTPEYLGKKIEACEMKFVALLSILPAALTLIATAFALTTDTGVASLSTHSSHGITEALHACTSASMNNGSSFLSLQADTPFYNGLLAIAMYVARFFAAGMLLALAGSLAAKKHVAVGVGTLPTDSVPFGLWFAFVILIVGALNFLPTFILGPVMEHMSVCRMWHNAF